MKDVYNKIEKIERDKKILYYASRRLFRSGIEPKIIKKIVRHAIRNEYWGLTPDYLLKFKERIGIE